MNKLKIDEMIIAAMKNIESNKNIKMLENGKIKSHYYGHVAAFGPSLIQTGLLQCIAFYSKKDETGRRNILKLMEKILEDTGRINKKPDEKDLFHHLRNQLKDNSYESRKRFTSYMMEACTACKLALRTFPKAD